MKTKIEDLEDRKNLLEIGELRNKTLLDIGVGPLAIIAAKDFNCYVTNIDISPEALEKGKTTARKEGLSNKIKFERQDATTLLYTDNSFDVVISYGTLHHTPLDRRERFIHEVYRVAREKVIVAEFNEIGFPHSEDEYARVNLNWLEKELNLLNPRIDKYQGKRMNVYICFS